MPQHLRAPLFLSLLLVALTSGRTASGQDVTVDDETLTFQFDEIEGTPLDDFIKVGEAFTGLQFTYEAQDTKDVKLRFIGAKTIARDQFWAYFQAVLRSKEFVLVEYGNVAAPGRPTEGPDTGYYAIRRTSGSVAGAKVGYIKSQAPVVSPEQLDYYRYDPGVVLTTSFTLKYVNVQEAVNMLSTYFTDPTLESVRAVNNSNSFVATGFAQTLYGIKELIKLIDTKPTEFTPQYAKIDLEHGVAEEIKPIVDQLIQAERGTLQGGNRTPGAVSSLPAHLQEFEPHVEADPRSNSLHVVAAAQSLEKITNYIRMLDVEVDPRGDSHVYRLKNSAAKDLAEILDDWSQKLGTGSSGGGGGGAGGGTGGANEQPIVVVADEASNSLIISASKSRYAQVLEIVKKLDVRRRQVLIETALVEISGTLNDNLGVELGAISVNENNVTQGQGSFGISNFGLSELQDLNGDGISDFRVPIGLTPGSSPVSGITAGIFSTDDFQVPVVLNALKATTDANVLSMPSVLVNDNEEAIIQTIEEQPTFTNTLSGNGNSQEAFQDFVDAGIQLNISPSISAGNYLRMLMRMEVSTFVQSTLSPPPRNTRELRTSVTLPDGHTMVVGGIVADDQRNAHNRVPFLGDLPLLGWIFGNKSDSDLRTNLYVFITPHIISDDFANLDDLSYLKKKEMEALNGKIYLVDEDWDRDNADTRIIEAGVSGAFDMPSYASPPAGEVKSGRPTPPTPTSSWQYGEVRNLKDR